MSILICVPTYNEAEAVKAVIKLLRSEGFDFVICDGFSTDNTVSIAKAENAEIIHRDSIGKGFAITKCLEIAYQRGYQHMGIIDCDLTYSVNDLTRLYRLAIQDNYDMVVGGRPFSKIAWHRRLANYFISAYFNLLFISKVKDIVSGLRILKVEKYNGCIKAISFDVEPRILAYTVKNKLKYVEVPISYAERAGESKANLIELYRILWGITDERIKP
jgi:glycosyltransferase involved in cell wall biosynthesis